MYLFNKSSKALFGVTLTFIALIGLSLNQIQSNGILNVWGAPTDKNFTFDKNSVPNTLHGGDDQRVSLTSSGAGRSDILYTPFASYDAIDRHVQLGGNYLMSLPNDSGAGDYRFLEFYFGVNNLTSLSVTIGHTLANPTHELLFAIHLYEDYDRDDVSTGIGDQLDLIYEYCAPGTYSFNFAEIAEVSFTVNYAQVCYFAMHGDNMDPANGLNMFIASIALAWSC
ncbi:MAG: hypothetical protein ACOX3K_05055 [Bacilli bacterium]